MGKIFKTATAFRKSLESRLMRISQETAIDLQRLRRKVAFDRLLARFFIGKDWLEFAGISPATIYAISKEQQFAEKLHAYTLPRMDRLNTRVKDLVDMLLLIREGSVHETIVRENLYRVFQRRNTHSLPATLPLPPEGWNVKFILLAKECGINESLDRAMESVEEFYQKVVVKNFLSDVLLP